MTILKKKYKVSLLVILAIIISRMMVTSTDVDMQSLKAYCKNKGYSTEYCILVDFSRPSGTKRFLIYSFKDEKILYKSLCTNGCGKEKNIFNSTFSNEIGSNYSSLGRYKVGNLRKMTSEFYGKGYTTYGLDSSNSNAFKRAILIHQGNPPFELYPLPAIPVSKGCFAVSDGMMKHIAEIKAHTSKPILLYAYK
jgi:hypothetical protein